jgi:tetratricopeptide (TPR) repeat protein
LTDLNRFEEALDDYDKALVLTPDFALALSNRARVRQYLGRLEEGRADYQRALALAPGKANVWLDYADSLEVSRTCWRQWKRRAKTRAATPTSCIWISPWPKTTPM